MSTMANNEEETDNGVPVLIKMNRLQEQYKNMQEEDEDGNIVPLKMQATKEFKAKFNLYVHSLLYDCVSKARQSGRKILQPEDVPDVPTEA